MNLSQGQLKKKLKKCEITQKTTQPENNLLPQDIDWRHAVLSYNVKCLK